MTATSKEGVGPVPRQKWGVQLLQDFGQEAGVFLFLGNEQGDGPGVKRITGFFGELSRRGQQASAVRAFAQLETGERAGQRPMEARVEGNAFVPGDAAA